MLIITEILFIKNNLIITLSLIIGSVICSDEWKSNMYRNTNSGTNIATSFINNWEIGTKVQVQNFGKCLRECTKSYECLAGEFENDPTVPNCYILKRSPTFADLEIPLVDNNKFVFWKCKNKIMIK